MDSNLGINAHCARLTAAWEELANPSPDLVARAVAARDDCHEIAYNDLNILMGIGYWLVSAGWALTAMAADPTNALYASRHAMRAASRRALRSTSAAAILV